MQSIVKLGVMKDEGAFNHQIIERKWQKRWEKEKINYPPDMLEAKRRFYNLWMFPYPSAEGMHVGTIFASTGSDVFGRFARMRGHDVFQPVGYDSFGIHAENYAIKENRNPKVVLSKTLKNYERQFKEIGHGYDWTRTVTTSDIDYYRWTQWLFVQMFKAGLAYRKKSIVNWCPSCKTVLADEQVMTPAQAGKEPKMIDGSKIKDKGSVKVCERCGYVAEKKDLEQWHFRITDYADKLLANLGKIDWPERIKTAQKNWIGKSEGLIEKWRVKGTNIFLETFTTWPHTTFGATFMVIAPEHPIINRLVKGTKYEKGARRFIGEILEDKKRDPRSVEKEKKGFFLGRHVINHLVGHEMPLYIANFAVMDYGTGIVKCTPTHDQRDFEFAAKYKLPKILVVTPKNKKLDPEKMKKAYTGSGVMTGNTGKFKGMKDHVAIDAVAKYSIKLGHAKKATQYHLRDWIISRQRYWGPPIPMIYCDECAKKGKSWFDDKTNPDHSRIIHSDQSDWAAAGWYPEENLPVELPFIDDYKPKGTGRGPLDDHPEFYETKCPDCGGKAKRETDVSDTFLDSSWYFLAYPQVRSKTFKKGPSARSGHNVFDKRIMKFWLPVNLYFGGAEHSVLHLMYARFVTMALYDMGFLDFEEPFTKFYAHGLMIKDGAKMSKSRGNVVNPDEYIKKYGADTLRLYLMFMGPMDGYPDFRDTGIEGMKRFLEKVWKLFQTSDSRFSISDEDKKVLLHKMHQTIKKVTKDIEGFKYNTAISAIMEYVNLLKGQVHKKKLVDRSANWQVWQEALKALALLLAPFAPHIAEQAWCEGLGEKFSVHKSAWPKYISEYVKEETVEIAIQVNGKLRSAIRVKEQRSKIKDQVIKEAKKDEKVKKWIEGKKIKNTVFVPGRLLNFVVS
ncbi:MAG: leucine--tRNA ligase [Candidatus Hermodarchaeia archaeon]|jgi:leucyl-tRNA synthetase